MAITQTGAMYKSLTFDNKSSRSYGVYITGEAVYNAPERAVEMISIPGRNGAFALDQGRFENIEVSYPAGIFAENESDFAQAVSDFRNFLCSKRGYCRLTDEYNPSEYRMAVYKSGLEVDPAQLRAGEFTITFECKPQRFLTSGETATSVASGGTVTNPTLFDASPLVEAEGYGTIEFNGYEIEIANTSLGEIELFEQTSYVHYPAPSITFPPVSFNPALVNTGDTLTLNTVRGGSYYGSFIVDGCFKVDSAYTIKGIVNSPVLVNMLQASYAQGRQNGVLAPITFTIGTASTVTGSCAIDWEIANSSQVVVETVTLTVAVSVAYDGNNTISATITTTISNDTLGICSYYSSSTGLRQTISKGIANSSVNLGGHPTYLDCDLGEAYKIENGEAISLNAYIDLGSELPTLASGSNTITYDNTITSLKIAPRWWKV